MNSEARVGALFFIGLGVMISFTLFVADFEFTGGEYTVYFDAVGALETGSVVTYNGVRVGSVRGIAAKVVNDEARVEVRFDIDRADPEVLLINPETRFQISEGVLGGSSLAITTQGSGVPISEQKTLNDFTGETPYGMQKAIGEFGQMSTEIKEMVQENRDSLKRAVDELPVAVENVSGAAGEIRSTVKENRERIDRAIENIEKISDDFAKISGQVASGKGTLGKLVFEDNIADSAESALTSLEARLEEVEPLTSGFSDLRFYIGAAGAFQTDNSRSAGDVYIRIEPKRWKFYEAGITWRTAPEDRDVEDEDPDEFNIDLNLMFGWRFFPDDEKEMYWLSVRGGLIEGQFGGGVDLQLFHERLRLRSILRAKDNDRDENDRRFEDGSLMARAWLEYRLWRGIHVIAGVNDIADDPSVWLGIRGEILDSDIRNATAASSLSP